MSNAHESDIELTVETDPTFSAPTPIEDSIQFLDDEVVDVVTATTRVSEPFPLEAVIESLSQTITSRLDGLQSQFDREVRAESTREKMVDRLHAELQEYKNGLLIGILRPVFVDLIQLHDDIGKMVDSTDSSEGEVSRLLEVMRGFQQGVVDILYRQGVEPFQVEGDQFDARRQRAISTVSTDDPNLNKFVAQRHRPGFGVENKVIRPEVVSVYSLKKQSSEVIP